MMEAIYSLTITFLDDHQNNSVEPTVICDCYGKPFDLLHKAIRQKLTSSRRGR